MSFYLSIPFSSLLSPVGNLLWLPHSSASALADYGYARVARIVNQNSAIRIIDGEPAYLEWQVESAQHIATGVDTFVISGDRIRYQTGKLVSFKRKQPVSITALVTGVLVPAAVRGATGACGLGAGRP